MISALVAGLLAGLVSAPHCLGMCGPLAAYAAIPPRQSGEPTPIARAMRPLRWQIGRLASYSLVGAIAGGAGAQVLRALAPAWMTTALSIALGLALLVAAWRLVRPASIASNSTRADVRTIGTRPRTPISVRILSHARREPLALGFLTALLPCGALWSGALVAAGAGSWAGGALAMLGFAIASGAALFLAGTVGAKAMTNPTPAFRRVLAASLVIGALITFARPIPQMVRGEDAAASCHAH